MQPTSKPGLVHLYCGDGKGKTTAAMGLALRALGAGHSVTILQFLKDGSSAELAPLRTLGARVLAGQTGSRFVFQMTEAERAQTRQYQSELLRTVLADPCDLLIWMKPAPPGSWIWWTGTCCKRRCSAARPGGRSC